MMQHAHTIARCIARLALPLLLVLDACAPRAAAEHAILGASETVRVADIAYGSDERQRLDVYHAKHATRDAPVMVFLYGGRWKYGNKRDYLLVGNELAKQGWIVVIPDYRLFPQVKFPGWVEDAASAVRWTHDHLAALGGDSTRLFVMGHSAGAHSAAMLDLDPHFLRDAGVNPRAVRGYISLAGPNDTTWTDADVQELMGPREGWPKTYPYNFVDGSSQPLLLLHGTIDHVVSPGNSERLARLINSRGGCAILKEYNTVGHVEIALALALPWLNSATVLRDVEAFVKEPACRAPAPVRNTTR